MEVILIAILSLITLIAYFLIIKPLVPLLLLKLQLGDKAILMFNPISGFIGVFTKSIKTNHDVMEIINHALRKNPKAKIILSNYLDKPCIMLTGSEYIKDTYLDHHDFEKINPFMLPSFI